MLATFVGACTSGCETLLEVGVLAASRGDLLTGRAILERLLALTQP